jgi:hypothetical protein
MKRHLVAAAALVGLLAPTAVPAEELDLGWFGSAEYDDNIFNTDEDEGDKTDDVVLRTGPILGLRRPAGEVTYEVRYEPRYEYFIDDSADDEFDHSAFGRARWQIAPTTSLTAVERFNVTHSLNRGTFIDDPTLPDVPGDLDVEVARQEIIRNAASLTLQHSFTSRLQGTLTGDQGIFRTDRDDRFESDSWGGSSYLTYTLTEFDQIGGGFAVNFQDYHDIENDAGVDQEGQDSISYNLFATWYHTFDPTFSFRVQAGPAWVDVDELDPVDSQLVTPFPLISQGGGVSFVDSSTCLQDEGVPIFSAECQPFGTIFQGTSAAFIRNNLNGSPVTVFLDDEREDAGNDLTVFASAELQKRWEHFRVFLTYSRHDSSSSGVGQSTILDTLALNMIWEPARNWTVSFLAQASLREDASNPQGNVFGLAPTTVDVGGVFVPGFMCPCVLQDVPASQVVSLRLVENDNKREVLTYRAQVRVKRRFGRNTEVFGQLTYLRQTTDDSFDDREFNNFRALIGARFMFDPLNVL